VLQQITHRFYYNVDFHLKGNALTMNFSAAHAVEGAWELAQKTSDEKSYYFVIHSVSRTSESHRMAPSSFRD
jgi:hypothetical protein